MKIVQGIKGDTIGKGRLAQYRHIRISWDSIDYHYIIYIILLLRERSKRKMGTI